MSGACNHRRQTECARKRDKAVLHRCAKLRGGVLRTYGRIPRNSHSHCSADREIPGARCPRTTRLPTTGRRPTIPEPSRNSATSEKYARQLEQERTDGTEESRQTLPQCYAVLSVFSCSKKLTHRRGDAVEHTTPRVLSDSASLREIHLVHAMPDETHSRAASRLSRVPIYCER